ncbi:MAG: signal peptide peptidase SppA [Acidobacteriota bacterium]
MQSRQNRLLILSILGISVLLLAGGLATLFLADRVPSRSVLKIRLADSLPERHTTGPLGRFLGWRETTVLDLVRVLDAAREDSRVRAVTIEIAGAECGPARAQEVRQAIHRFRSSGKYVGALLEWGSLVDFYLASAADDVFLLPGGTLDMAGLAIMVPFARGALDHLGVIPQFEIAGEEKDAPDVYMRHEMSPIMRRSLERLLDGLLSQILDGLAADRGLDRDKLEAMVDSGFLTAPEAVERRLADGILHEDKLAERARERTGEDLEELQLADYLGGLAPSWFSRPPKIALVYATGTLVSGESDQSQWLGELSGSESLARAFRTIREDDRIKAVVLRIDSPGGSSTASEMIWREVVLTGGEKPVVVSMGDTAASGGYFIAAGADQVLAQPTTITGSVGVFAGKFAMRGFYDWIGINWGVVKRGRNADMLMDLDPWTEEQRRLMRNGILAIHQRFQEVVATGRHLDPGTVKGLATGRIFSGEEAVRLGLADALGGLREALQAARSRAGLAPGEPIAVELFPRPEGLLAGLLSGASMTSGPLPPVPASEVLRQVMLWRRLGEERYSFYFPYRLRPR